MTASEGAALAAPAVLYLDVELMERMCHRLAVVLFDQTNDPIAPFHLRTIALLDSALHLPRQTFDGHELYPTLLAKATVLFYGLIKNHPFPNGNKRIATVALLVFLSMNDRWLRAPPEQFFRQAIAIAQSDPADRTAVLASFRTWLAAHVVGPHTWADVWRWIRQRLRTPRHR